MRLGRFAWLMVVAGMALSGCAGTVQGLKGVPQRLSLADQDVVNTAFASSKRIAVVVGISAFEDSNWSKLSYPVKDAEDFAAVLNDSRYGHFDKVITLTDPQQTTRASILAAVRELAREDLSAEDTLVFYISSHGTIARTADGKLRQYVVTQDTRFNDIPDTAIDLNDLKAAFNGMKSQKKALVLAFCHSGRGKSQLDPEMLSELKTIKTAFFVKPLETVSEATVVLAASAWGETAREDNRLKNDIYTHFLIEGIKKNDRNGDGAVSISEAHDYAREQTYYYTKGEQRPSMESMILGTDPIILSGEIVRSGRPVVYDYSHRYEGLTMFVDGQKKGTLPMGVAVDAGVHLVEVRTGDSARPLYDEVFSAGEGQRIALPILLNGYDQGIALRAGYQGFMSEKIDNNVAKPLPMYGLAYSNHSYFSPHLGYRADVAYGQETQTLTVGSVTTQAKVSETSYGVALLYRYALGGLAIYAGPRLGGLNLQRTLAVGNLGTQSDTTATIGGVLGLHFQYKKQVTFMVEGALNSANIQLGNTNDNSSFYNVFGGLSVNF